MLQDEESVKEQCKYTETSFYKVASDGRPVTSQSAIRKELYIGISLAQRTKIWLPT